MSAATTAAVAVAAAAGAGLATLAGALPVVLLRPRGRKTYDAVLGLGAGLMIAAAIMGLLGHAVAASKGRALFVLAGAFFVGVALMFVLERLVPHRHARGHEEHRAGDEGAAHEAGDEGAAHEAGGQAADPEAGRKGYLIAGALTLHRVPEGFAIGAGFMLGEGRLGVFLAIALALQNICEGVVLTVPLQRGGLPLSRSLAVATGTGLSTPLAAVLGVALFARPCAQAFLPATLALSAGALLYLVLAEMLPESHGHGNEKLASLALAVGFGLGLVLHLLVGRH